MTLLMYIIISRNIEHAVVFLLSFVAGGFIYIAAIDLIPEIKKSMATMIVFICGILIMWLIKLLSSLRIKKSHI